MKKTFYIIDVDYNQQNNVENNSILTGEDCNLNCAKLLMLDNGIYDVYFSPRTKIEKVSDEEYKHIISNVLNKILINNPSLKNKYISNGNGTASRFAFPISSLKAWNEFNWINKKTKQQLNITKSSSIEDLSKMCCLKRDKNNIFDSIIFLETDYFLSEYDGCSWTASPLPVPSFLWMIYGWYRQERTTDHYIVIPEIYKMEGEEYDTNTLSVEDGAKYLRDWVEGNILNFIEDGHNILYPIKQCGIFRDLIMKYDKYAERGINLSKLPDYEEVKKFEQNLIVSNDGKITPITDYLIHNDVGLYPIYEISMIAKKLKQNINEYYIYQPTHNAWGI